MDKNHQTTPQPPQIDANRRRLTKAGLAAPAVLGTLASRRVLGADYYCTTSGQTSGNTSTHGEDDGCDIAGTVSPAALTTAGDNWGEINPEATFNGYTYPGSARSLPALFWRKTYDDTESRCVGKTMLFSGTGSGNQATLLEVMTLDLSTCHPAPSVEILTLARATIATIVNATKTNISGFPITPGEAVAMFEAVYLGGSYQDEDWQNKNASWDAGDVLCYFKLLYGEVTGCSGLTTGAQLGAI